MKMDNLYSILSIDAMNYSLYTEIEFCVDSNKYHLMLNIFL